MDVGKLEVAIIIRRGGSRDAGATLTSLDLTAGDGRSARVADESENGGGLKLGLEK